MKIIGVIIEYNPLHNGHIYHIEQIKKEAKPDLIIAVLSSNLTMRGDLSLYDKFTKTKQALQNHIDIVIELPLILSMQKADIFAENAVHLLHLAKVNEIWIGSETNSIETYKKAYQALEHNQTYIQQQVDKGLSYKSVTYSIYPLKDNDILGYSYYKAIQKSAYPIQLKTILRKNSAYCDSTPTDTHIASALAIRNNLHLLETYTPSYVFEQKDKIRNEEAIFPYLKYQILSHSPQELKTIFFVDEGLENKLKDIYSFSSLSEFIQHLTTSRYTSTRIKRMLMYILFHIDKQQINSISKKDISFLRILGYSQKGRTYLSELKKDVPIYTNIKEGLSPILDIEWKVTKILDMIYHTDTLKCEQGAPVQL